MKPVLAKDDANRTVVVLDFVVAYYGNFFAIVVDPDGGRPYKVLLEDIHDMRPTTEWPIAPEGLD